MNKKVTGRTGDGVAAAYETYRGIVDMADIEYGRAFKEACRACPTYGKNFACPPHSPFFPEFVGRATRAEVICIRLPLAKVDAPSAEEEIKETFRKAGRILSEILLHNRERGLLVAGSGPCRACDLCAAEAGEDRCRNADGRIYSLESLGVNVIALAKRACGIELQWATGSRAGELVSAVGAVFFDEAALSSG